MTTNYEEELATMIDHKLYSRILYHHNAITEEEYERQQDNINRIIKNLEEKIGETRKVIKGPILFTAKNSRINSHKASTVRTRSSNKRTYYVETTTGTILSPDLGKLRVYDTQNETLERARRIGGLELMAYYAIRIVTKDIPNKNNIKIELFERKSIPKEELVMAVFHPNRLERMIETYGNDWIENV